MHLDKELYFPLYSSTSKTPSIFSAPSTTSQHGNINSFSRLLNGFITDSNQGQSPMLSINDPMQLSHTSLHNQPQMEGLGFDHFRTNFAPNYWPLQFQNAPLLDHSLQLDHHTPSLIGLNNSLLKVPNYHDLNLKSPAVLLPPVGNDKVLIGDDDDNDNNKVQDDGRNIKKKPKKSTKKGICKSARNGGSNIQIPLGRRKAYRRKSKSIFGERSSMYRGVSRYTGRFEAFLWDNTDPSVKGRTVYVGGFEREEDAARAYDLAALKFWGPSAPLNFPKTDYQKELAAMQYVSKEEFLLKIRRKSKGFAKGVSNYRGVSRNSDGKKWQARIGKGKGLNGLYLGTFQTEVEAARAYDVAVLRMKGLHAITNFDINHYDIRYILESSRLPIGEGASKMLRMNAIKDVLQSSRKTCNKRFPVLELPVPDDHDYHHADHQIMISEPNPHDHEDQYTLGGQFQSNSLIPTPTSTENPNTIAPNALDHRNPSSYFEFGSPFGGVSNDRFYSGMSQDHGGNKSNIINGIANLEFEDSRLFDVDQFYLKQNPSFDNHDQPLHENYQMQNLEKGDHDQLQKNSSFLNLFIAAGSTGNRSNDDQEWALKNLTMTAEAGQHNDDAASTDMFWSEFQHIETPEFHNIDFHDFFSHDDHNNIDADFQNLLQNPILS